MSLSFVVPANLVLEIIMLGVEGYAFNYNRHHYFQPIDITFLSVVPAFLALSIVWLLILKCLKCRCSKLVRFLRILQGIGMLSIGILMIVSERSISKSRSCHDYEQKWLVDCQLSVPKIVAGVLAMLDGIVYFLRPQKGAPSQESQSLLRHASLMPVEEDKIPITVGIEIATDPSVTSVDGATFQTQNLYPVIGFAPNYQQQQQLSNIPLGPNQPYENPPPYFEAVGPIQNQPSQHSETPQFYNYGHSNYGAATENFPTAPKI